jgi:hypothetical protein
MAGQPNDRARSLQTNDYEHFAGRLRASQAGVWAVAQHLHCQGDMEVTVRPHHIRKPNESPDGHRDSEDIVVRPFWRSEIEWRYEIKGTRMVFTTQWVRDRIMVDRVNAKKVLADGYYILNLACTHAVFVSSSTREDWSVVEFNDWHINEIYDVYECPIELARMVELKRYDGIKPRDDKPAGARADRDVAKGDALADDPGSV